MPTKAISLTIIIVFLSACTSMHGTPDQRRAKNAALSDYSLCEKLTIATLAPQSIRSEWALELQQRGADCSKYAGMLNNAVQQQNNLMNTSLQLMQQPANPSTSASNGTTCIKKK